MQDATFINGPTVKSFQNNLEAYLNVKHVIKGEKSKLIKFNALYALISHPDKGYILFDTGYTRRFYDATKSYPNKIYANETKVTITKSNEVKSQLESIGIKAEEIKHIIIMLINISIITINTIIILE